MVKTPRSEEDEPSKNIASAWGQLPAWLTAAAAIGALFATTYFQWASRRNQIQDELLAHRRTALFSALEVIDDTYDNEPRIGANPHKWDIKLAHDAENQMIVYCRYPETLSLFVKALGLHDASDPKGPGIDIHALVDFRKQVARELDLPDPVALDPNLVWIRSLSGTGPSESSDKPVDAQPKR